MLSQLSPIRLAVRREPFDHPDWIFELKYDGFRALLIAEDGAARLVSRNAHVYKGFPRLAEELARGLAGFGAIVLDGEIVCLDANGCPQFDLFYRRGEPYFYAFDNPWLNGQDLRTKPLGERKRLLRSVVPESNSRLLYARHVEGRGIDLFREVCRRDLEGIVAKWKHGPYVSGDVTSW